MSQINGYSCVVKNNLTNAIKIARWITHQVCLFRLQIIYQLSWNFRLLWSGFIAIPFKWPDGELRCFPVIYQEGHLSACTGVAYQIVSRVLLQLLTI